MTTATWPHGPDCRSCAAVDSWSANRKRRPTGKQLAAMSDGDFASFIEDSGIGTNSRLPTTSEAAGYSPTSPLRESPVGVRRGDSYQTSR